MGENILILAFVVIIIGGIGSIRGAFIASIFVGLIDTVGRAFIPDMLKLFLSSAAASTAGPGSVVDADLSPDGGRAGRAPGGAVSGRGQPMKPLFTARNVVIAAAGRWRCSWCRSTRSGPSNNFILSAVHPHRHPRDRGDEPQSDHGLWRHGELRPRRLSRHRRLCGRHSRLRRRGLRLRAMAARARRVGAGRARHRRCSRCARAASISS